MLKHFYPTIKIKQIQDNLTFYEEDLASLSPLVEKWNSDIQTLDSISW